MTIPTVVLIALWVLSGVFGFVAFWSACGKPQDMISWVYCALLACVAPFAGPIVLIAYAVEVIERRNRK